MISTDYGKMDMFSAMLHEYGYTLGIEHGHESILATVNDVKLVIDAEETAPNLITPA